jgi:hypothetical protein
VDSQARPCARDAARWVLRHIQQTEKPKWLRNPDPQRNHSKPLPRRSTFARSSGSKRHAAATGGPSRDHGGISRHHVLVLHRNLGKAEPRLSFGHQNGRVAIHHEAADVMATAAEGFCSLCNRALSRHARVACCRCCGTVYTVEDGRLGLSTCDEHSRECAHLSELWERRRASA